MSGETVGDIGITPSQMTDNAIVEAQNSMRIFTRWFGEAPYGRIAITQQPQANFGQSWPTLVYLPLVSFLDSTQRYMLLNRIAGGLTDFIQIVTPHEVAHQWWGHIVGWASFHDQWLSEGFADFSAGLYLQATEKKPDKYLNFWKRHQETILEKNEWNRRANDAGPLWMGLRLNTYKNRGAYNRLVYPKGGYILHMLRSMMYDQKTGDERFIAMMHDFVKTHFNQNASTEGFKRVVEKHMTKKMDLDETGKMDWFFNEWVYGTEVPSYKFEYSVKGESDGKFMLTGVLTQSGVSENFKMLVPIYLDLDGKIVRLGQANVTGNTSTPEFKVRLPQKPRRVLINAHHDVLAVESVSTEKK
jgi:aminopeptidase N